MPVILDQLLLELLIIRKNLHGPQGYDLSDSLCKWFGLNVSKKTGHMLQHEKTQNCASKSPEQSLKLLHRQGLDKNQLHFVPLHSKGATLATQCWIYNSIP